MEVSKAYGLFGSPLKLRPPEVLGLDLESDKKELLRLDPADHMLKDPDPLMLKENKPKEANDKQKKISYQSTYLASTQNYYENTLEGGYLPVLNSDLQLLLRYFQVQNAAPPENGDFLHPQKTASTQGVGTQFRLTLSNQAFFYGRAEISKKDTFEDSFLNSTLEAIYCEPAESLLLRSVFSTVDGKEKFMNQMYIRQPILENDRLSFRLGVEQSTTLGEGTNLTILGKLDGVVRPDPWWGWNFQFFVPMPTQVQQAEDYPGVGIFFWTGFVHSKNAFSEIMFYVNTRNIDFGYQDYQDLVAGIILKTKFGTEARWWP